MPAKVSNLRWLWLTLAVVLVDRVSKAWFETQTIEGWRHELIHNLIYLVHSRNAGIAAVKVPFTVGGTDGAKDLFGLFDDTIARLLGAVK